MISIVRGISFFIFSCFPLLILADAKENIYIKTDIGVARYNKSNFGKKDLSRPIFGISIGTRLNENIRAEIMSSYSSGIKFGRDTSINLENSIQMEPSYRSSLVKEEEPSDSKYSKEELYQLLDDIREDTYSKEELHQLLEAGSEVTYSPSYDDEQPFPALDPTEREMEGINRGSIPRVINQSAFNYSKANNLNIMMNLYYDFKEQYGFKPYIMGGLGIATNYVKKEHLHTEDDHYTRPGFKKVTLSWALGCGIQKQLSSVVNFDVGYRYVNYGSFRTSSDNFLSASGNSIPNFPSQKVKLASHQILFGLVFNL